jgi:signal transduction histidine kinase
MKSGKIPPTSETIERSLGLADRQILRLGRLVEELLSVVRIQAGRLQIELHDVDLVEVVREVAASFAADLARAGSELEVRAPLRLTGRWDRAKLEHVVVNLLSNAVKFGAGKPILIAVAEHAGTARLTITDHGIGIEAERVSEIFEKFERAVSSRQYGGLGLGLYISRSIVQALGGTVTTESPGLGRGASFIVELPIAPRTQARKGRQIWPTHA